MKSQQLNYKNFKQNKAYFSAYLNMARHNAYITLSHLNKMLGFKPQDEDNMLNLGIVNILKEDKFPEKKIRAIELLNKHFPFLHPLRYYSVKKQIAISEDEEKDILSNDLKKNNASLFQEYHTLLITILKHLIDYRNFYTHQGHENIIADKRLFEFLDKIFDASIRTVKQRFELGEPDVEHLRRYKGFDKTNKKPRENPRFYYKFEKNGEITEKGLAFLCTLFLEKKYAADFLKKLHGFKDARNKSHQATFETYCVYRIRLPKERFSSMDENLRLSLDMLNELKRCPAPLYELLKKEDKNKILVQTDAWDTEEDNFEEKIILKRFSDRFPEFAMRYYDIAFKPDTVNGFRFHVDLGKYFYKFYEKTAADGEKRLRRLDIKLKTFGRPWVLDELRQKEWKDMIVSNPPEEYDKPYVQDTYPHYHINNNQIGIKFTQEEKLPELKGQDTKTQGPDCWLSIYELPGLIFLRILEKDSKTFKANSLIKRHHDNIRYFFRKCANGKILPADFKGKSPEQIKKEYKIDIYDIPDELKNILLGKEINTGQRFKKYAEDKVWKLIEQTDRKIEQIEIAKQNMKDKGNKPGKKRFSEIKAGIIADFIAEDLLYLQPSFEEKGKDKVTGQNFQVLQSSLALYGRNRYILKSIFRNCNLIDSKNRHPFLYKIEPEKHFSLLDFYKSYLINRRKYFENCIKKQSFKNCHFLKFGRGKWKNDGSPEYLKKLAKKYLDLPVNLPRGIFNNAIEEWFAQNGSEKMKKLIEQTGRVNTVYLTAKYFELELNDKHQEFYDYKRSYKFIDQLFDTQTNSKTLLERKDYSTEELDNLLPEIKTKIKNLPSIENAVSNSKKPVYYREPMQKHLINFKKNEQVLRLIKAQDMLLFLMAFDLFGTENFKITIGDFKLREIMHKDQSVLNKQVPCSIKIHNKTITQPDLKIKNFGDFIRFAHDRRLEKLFDWIVKTNISRTELENELVAYEKARLRVLELVHRFEKNMFKYYKNDLDKFKLANEKYYAFKVVLDVFFENCKQFEEEKEILRTIRNAFSHNEFPDKNIIADNKDFSTFTDKETISEKIADFAQSLFEKYEDECFNNENAQL